MPDTTANPAGYTVDRYFDLVHTGELQPEDRVELLDGVIVAEPPQDPRHASATTRAADALRAALWERAVIRVQLPFIASPFSAPEPDVAVVPGRKEDYDDRHPSQALLIVEIAESSLPQDRLSKTRIYAAAACPEYWIVNLRDDYVEVYRAPEVTARRYTTMTAARRGEYVGLVAFPDARIAVSNLLPRAPSLTL